MDVSEPGFWERVEALAKDHANLYNALYYEVAWKNHSLRTGHFYLKALLNDEPRSRELCGDYLIALCEQHIAEHGTKPAVLDLGCGPVSSLAYLTVHDLAELTGIDPLAEEYATLLATHGVESPVRQVAGFGECLDLVFEPESFDIVFIRNALDHSQSPALTILNAFNALRVGGLLVQSHSIREATAQGWKQLHQFDLYPDEDGQMMIDDGSGAPLALTAPLPVEVEVKAINEREDGGGWFTTSYRKRGREVSDETFLRGIVHELRSALVKRSNQALDVEGFIVEMLRSHHPSAYGYPGEVHTRM